MTAARIALSLPRACVLSCLVVWLCCTSTGVSAERRPAALKRSRRNQSRSDANSRKGAHHRPLTDAQRADQNLQFMLSLYRSAAGPDGRPKQHRKFGSNTVRLLRPSASSVHYLSASRDHHYIFTVQYNLDALPMEQLVRASFVHLRSSSTASSAARALLPPRCRAQVTLLGGATSQGSPPPGHLVTLEPRDRWTETDITAHVSGHVLRGKSRGGAGHLTLTAQYWCAEPGRAEEVGGPSWWMPWGGYQNRVGEGKRKRWREDASEYHLEAPSLLLYLEEEREMKDWMGELLGAEREKEMTMQPGQLRPGQLHPARRRHRRSKDLPPPPPPSSSSDSTDPSLDALKDAPTSSSSFSTSPSGSIASDIPDYKRAKTSAPRNRCKLHSFRLSFDELGWGHYFIAPPVYNPRFCQGDCPRVLHYGYHSPNHAIIQTVISDMGAGEVPPPSCVPYKYMPMSVLVVHKKKVEYRELEDMVAESCTCR